MKQKRIIRTNATVSFTIDRCHVVIYNRADRETVKHTLYALQQICQAISPRYRRFTA